MTMTDLATPAPGRTRRNRGSEIVRDALVEAGIAAFAAHGFTGASTRAIAEAADAHQSQVGYHFASKDELWRRCVEQLLDELDDEFDATVGDTDDPGVAITGMFRGIVRFAARRPELSRILLHESLVPSNRLEWLVEHHTGERHDALRDLWAELGELGVTAPIDPDLVYHALVGAASVLYASAPEAQRMGIDVDDPGLRERHVAALRAMFVPGLR